MPARITAPPASQDREVLRLATPVALWWVWLAFVTLNVVDFAVQGLSSARFGAVISAVLLFVTGLAYTLALRPRVVMDGSGLTVVNPFRTHHVPWRLIRSVDTGEWVQIHYAPRAAGPETDPAGPEPDPDGEAAQTRTLTCWALYVSARARRKSTRGTPAARRGSGFWSGGRAARAAQAVGGYASSDGGSRLPEEARYLASLPVAKALAMRLDSRAARERARKAPQGQAPAQATARWCWPAFAVTVVPALTLLLITVLS